MTPDLARTDLSAAADSLHPPSVAMVSFRVVLVGVFGSFALSCASGEDGEKPATVPGSGIYDQQYPCSLSTDYAGDAQCLTAPEPADGFQLHYGPDSYDAAAVAPFLLEPGGEVTDCLYLTTPNDAEVFTAEYHARARPGTHHIIVWSGNADVPPDGTLRECMFDPGMSFTLGAQSGLGSNGVVLDVPLPGSEEAPENAGLGARLPPRTRIAFQMHYVNTTDKPLLREGWVNIHFKSAESVHDIVDPIFFIGGLSMGIQPGAHEVLQPAACELPADGPDELRILGVSGHMHSHGQRFSAYKIAPDGQRELFYQTFAWEEPLTAQFDSAHSYPAPNADSESAHSGILIVRKGDKIAWECEFHNDGATVLNFGNGAYTAEMCNLFGFYTPSFGGPWNCINF